MPCRRASARLVFGVSLICPLSKGKVVGEYELVVIINGFNCLSGSCQRLG